MAEQSHEESSHWLNPMLSERGNPDLIAEAGVIMIAMGAAITAISIKNGIEIGHDKIIFDHLKENGLHAIVGCSNIVYGLRFARRNVRKNR